MNFSQLQERLRLELLRRIDRGTLSGALLARQTGFAQAHISNLLHGRRTLSIEATDRIMKAQTISVVDLLPDRLLQNRRVPQSESDTLAVPLVSHSCALFDIHVKPTSIQDLVPVPRRTLDTMPPRCSAQRRQWERFVAIRVQEPQALAMEPVVRFGALAVLDRHYTSLMRYYPERPTLYAVRLGHTLLLRYVEFESDRLILRAYRREHPIQLIKMAPDEAPNDYIVGRLALLIAEP